MFTKIQKQIKNFSRRSPGMADVGRKRGYVNNYIQRAPSIDQPPLPPSPEHGDLRIQVQKQY